MKPINILYTLGFSLIILGLSYGAFSPKEYKEGETKLISYERSCLIESIYFEGRGTSKRERLAIAEVVLNRVRSKSYPDTICEVVHQPFQFSYYNAYSKNQIILPEFQNISSNLDQKAFLEIEELVDSKLVSGKIKPNTVLPKNTLYFHTKDVSPFWVKDRRNKRVFVDSSFKHKYYTFNN